MAEIPGSVRVTGVIAPTDSVDTYAVTDAQYGIDGLRNFSGDSTVLSAITTQRRRAGMIAGTISGGTRFYYRLNEAPWALDETDWVRLPLYDYTGGTEFTGVESAYWVSGLTSTSLKYANSPASTVGGDYSFLNGESNYAVGSYNIAFNGAGNIASGSQFSTIINGDSNVVHASNGTILNGESNTIFNIHSTILGGEAHSLWGHNSLSHGQSNVGYGDYSQVFGTNNIVLGQSQMVIGEHNVAQGTSGATIKSDYGFIIGGGTEYQRKNAFAVTREGLVQLNPQTGSTLPTTNVSDGALAYSSNTGFYQYISGTWTGFTTGAGGGSQTWQETITEGNVITTGSPTISGESLTFKFAGGATSWEIYNHIDEGIIITGSSLGALIYSGETFDVFKDNGEYFKIGNESGGLGYAKAYNGTNSGTLKYTNNLTGDREWNLPDQSGIIALLSDLTGNTGGAPQTLECLNPTTTWDLDAGHNAALTLSADTTLSVSNVVSGDYGTLVVTQDGTGGWEITPPGSSVVVNGAGGVLNLTSNASAVDILTFYYDGATYYWNLGGDYT